MLAGIPLPLVVAAVALVTLVGIAGLVLLRTSGEEKLLLDRIEQVTAFAKPARADVLPSITRKDIKQPDQQTDWRDALTGFLGFSFSRKEQYWLAWYWVVLIALVVGRVAVAMGSGVLGTLAWGLQPVVTVAVCRSLFNGMVQKRIGKLRAQFPDALNLIVRAVRVGVPVSEALRAVSREAQAPTAREFDKLADEIAIGAPMEQALRDMAARNSLPEYGFFAAALGLQAQTGGSLGETLMLLADVTRKRVAMKERGHALSAEARTSSMILGALPIVAGLALYLINPDYMSMLFTEESGRMILGLGLLSLSIGVFVMRMIIRKNLS